MAVVITEEHMAVGDWSIDLDWTLETHAELVYDGDNRNPRKVHVLISDPSGALAYTGVLLRVDGDERGLTIGGRSVLWYLGAGDIGPMIDDREYVSGADKLGNGSFDLDELYWRRPSEGSHWTFGAGAARCIGGLDHDDVLEGDEKFPTRPGNAYLMTATGVTGVGRLRVRIVFDGRFNPRNLFAVSTWTPADSTATVAGDVITFGPSTQPDYIEYPGLETSTGWSVAPGLPADIVIVTDATNAYNGTHVLRVGPVTQLQKLLNWDFSSGLTNWYTSSNLSEPDAVFYADAGGGFEGTTAATTDGAATSTRAIKYLRADSSSGTSGVQAYGVVAGETWEVEAQLRAAPSTDGYAYLSLVFPHPTLEPLHPRWSLSQTIEGPRNSTDEFHRIAVSDTVPAGRTKAYVLGEVHDQTTGYYAFSNVTMTRTRGNRAQANNDFAYDVTPNGRYELSVLARSSDDLQVGEMRLGVVLSGPGMVDQVVDVNQGSTDFVWSRIAVEVRPPTGYTAARPFIAAMDIVGAPIYVDEIHFRRIEGNSTTVTRDTTVSVTPERSYTWTATVYSSVGATRGNVHLTARCQRAGHPAVEFDSQAQEITGGTHKTLTFNFTPPSGYDLLTAIVTGSDIEGGTFTVESLDLRDADTSTIIAESVLAPEAETTASVAAIAPSGAEIVRAVLVADEGSTDWTVDAVSLVRTGVTPATGNAIVNDLLHDPDTGAPLAVLPGVINCPEVIPYDWPIRNMTGRNALDRFCQVVSSPPREYRVNADRTIDVGTPEEVFTDHAPDSDSPIVLLRTDIDVEPLPTIGSDVELRPTQVHLVGADRQTVSGRPFTIEATAVVPGAAELDYDGRPINRTLTVTDGTVDHLGYAQALADDLADKQARPSLSLDVTLTGVATRPPFTVGDWLYMYHPEAGLESLDYPTTIEGDAVFPRRVRVFTRKIECGPRWSIVLRREDGTTIPLGGPLPGFIPSDRDAVTLTVGDRRPDWQSGGALPAGVEYLRDRSSAPR